MGNRFFNAVTAALSFAVFVAASGQAEAAATVGDAIGNVTAAFSNFPKLLAAIAYISGLYFAIAGVFKFKDHVDNPAQHPISAGVKRFLAGGMLLSAPTMMRALYGTLFGAGGNVITRSGRHGIPGGDGVDATIVKFIYDFTGPMEILLQGFTYVAALALLLVGIVRLTKTAQEGPRGPAGLGTMMTFLASGALFSFGSMLGAFSTSLFGNPTVSTYANISTAAIGAGADTLAPVVEAVMAFVMIVGYIAFIRGWFVLKAFADGGSQQATLAQGLTFLFGGALAINLGELINALGNSLGFTALTFG